MSKRLYEVEKIIGRNVFTGKVYYLVKWKGFPSCESTWESVKVLGNVRDMIRDFNQGLKKSIQSPQTDPVNPLGEDKPFQNELSKRERKTLKRFTKFKELVKESKESDRTQVMESKMIGSEQPKDIQEGKDSTHAFEQSQTALRYEHIQTTAKESDQGAEDMINTRISRLRKFTDISPAHTSGTSYGSPYNPSTNLNPQRQIINCAEIFKEIDAKRLQKSLLMEVIDVDGIGQERSNEQKAFCHSIQESQKRKDVIQSSIKEFKTSLFSQEEANNLSSCGKQSTSGDTRPSDSSPPSNLSGLFSESNCRLGNSLEAAMMPKIVKRIYFLNNFTNSEEKYLIEYMDGSLKKAGTEEACKMHPLELIRFLEASLTMSDVAGRAQERS